MALLKGSLPIAKRNGVTDWAGYVGSFLDTENPNSVRDYAEVSSDGMRILVYSASTSVLKNQFESTVNAAVFDTQQMRAIWTKKSSKVDSGRLQVCMSPDGKMVAMFAPRGTRQAPQEPVVEILDIDSKQQTTLPPPKESARNFLTRFLFSPDGKWLAAIRIQLDLKRSTLTVWDTQPLRIQHVATSGRCDTLPTDTNSRISASTNTTKRRFVTDGGGFGGIKKHAPHFSL